MGDAAPYIYIYICSDIFLQVRSMVRLFTGNFAKFSKSKKTLPCDLGYFLGDFCEKNPKVTDIVAAAEEDDLISPEAQLGFKPWVGWMCWVQPKMTSI